MLLAGTWFFKSDNSATMNRGDHRKKQSMKPGAGTVSVSMNVSRKSSHSFGTRSIRTTGAGSRSNLFNSSSRKSVAIDSSRGEKAPSKPPVQVFDDMGQDVTPRSLLHVDPTIKRNQSNTFFAAGESIATSFYAASNASMYGGFSRSVFGSVSGRSSPESVSEDLHEPSSTYHDKFSASLGDIQTRPTFAREELTEADLDKMLLKNRVGNDSYVERGMQTFNNGKKSKEIQSTKVELHEVGCTATNWDMYDTYNALETNQEGEKDDGEDVFESLSRPTSGEHTSSHDDSESMGSVRAGSAASGSVTGSRASLFTFKSSSIDEEIADKQEDTDIDAEKPDTEDASSAVATLVQLGPNLHKLWNYSCNLTKGRNVSCMAWNKLNPDILAVGYGEFVFSEQKGGLACCWSLKNPEYPERYFHLISGVTALDFSAAHPNLLAVGMYDGTIAIYNVRNRNDMPALDSYESQGKHSSPVWQVRWVDRDQGAGEERDEILISISADGRVTKWSIRKGFESADLMKLKRINVAKQARDGGRKSDALISRFAPGFCFDVHPNDSNGPVYRLQWSPFLSDAFLSCSADWSIRLWHQDKPQPIMTFISSTKSVNDVCWCPSSATLFACVNDKAVEIWDLSVSTLDPIISYVPVQELKLSVAQILAKLISSIENPSGSPSKTKVDEK
ncbi:Dynein axonemal intermediate chain 4 [Acropora cervicornis]|uniref:Dynein axonemal intermediate chain 4 n=1 Tax=Acropora cervicornis TaxID=6130 RepID=A0AAD9QZ82_ACRCE|nr:Dynein axonemal intermediate chain 4 [Acropora cervicornis]